MRLALFIACTLLSGCAAMSDPESRSSDGYQLGYRDAIFGLQPQDRAYAGVDPARYGQGWREGKWEFDSRMRKD